MRSGVWLTAVALACASALGCGASDRIGEGSGVAARGVDAARGEGAEGSSEFLYVWAAQADSDGRSFFAVIGADPASPDYGEILATSQVGETGRAHHTEHVMPAGDRLFANAFSAGRTYVFNVENPLAPWVEATFTNAGPYTFPHSFERTPEGNVLATFQNQGDGHGVAGGLVELDPQGNLVQAADAADPADPELLPYSVTLLPAKGLAVTTTADMRGELFGRSFQVWAWPDLDLRHTVLLPEGPRGDEHIDVAEARVLDDGETVIVTTFRCGMYVVNGLSSDQPSAEHIYTFPWESYEKGDECGLPLVMGRFWVQTVNATHSLAVLDMSDPHQPELVHELFFGETALPHWISAEPGGDRIVLTGEGSLMGKVLIVRMDRETGELSVVDDFRSRGAAEPGVVLKLDAEGDPARPHGVVFSRPPGG